jgi:hypothetical protein
MTHSHSSGHNHTPIESSQRGSVATAESWSQRDLPLPHRHVVEVTGPSLGPVVLDIGGAFGAAVVRTSCDLNGSEIEIRRLPSEWDGTHVAVRSRPSGTSPIYAAVFGPLQEGSYELRERPAPTGAYIHRLEVVGGSVVETTWPEAAHPA